jgi:high-affinity iron transporter
MLANLLIGLREGLEAALVVGILVAYLVKSGRREMVRWVWIGVSLAIAVSVGVWGGITVVAGELSERGEEIFAGVLSLVAVAFVTWMILWMRTAARHMKVELGGKLDRALVAGPAAVLATAFFAVAREGVETVLFLWSSMRAAGQGVGPVAGAVLGLGSAVVLGYLIYRGALRVNLGTFFTWTGVALIVLAAWVLGYGVEELGEAGVIPELEWLVPVLWVGYIGVMATLFFRRGSAEAPTLHRTSAPSAEAHATRSA